MSAAARRTARRSSKRATKPPRSRSSRRRGSCSREASGAWSRTGPPPPSCSAPGTRCASSSTTSLGALAALGAGFMATLRLPGAEDRPAARMLGQVAAALAEGVGVLEALLAAPAVSPGRLGIEALRLALGGAWRGGRVRADRGHVGSRRSARLDPPPALRRGVHRVRNRSAVPREPLPPRRTTANLLVVEGMPSDALLLAIEASRPADLHRRPLLARGRGPWPRRIGFRRR